AEMLGTNRTYLSKAINESTGKTFTQIVNDYRIREAIAQISDLETDKPLKLICSDVGFSSLSTFYSSFQSITGMTPARYRSQLKEI
ncbi:MAG: helix-turn-helix domain-containing protein, partial [Duncaniella sp.]|nr:helix-turn-helix domain-containing protein [Duncaniella sp.]